MKILSVHNRYQIAGGEDIVFEAESNLLESYGHQVIKYERTNREIENYSSRQRIGLTFNTLWSNESQRAIAQLIKEESPDIVHFHNTFPLISPAAYYVCLEAGVPVVQTLHNYRLICPNALLFRAGHICEVCLNKTPPWPGMLYSCYRNSRLTTTILVAMLTLHRIMDTWKKCVSTYIALTGFARSKFIEGGIPDEKIVVKPNFIQPDPGIQAADGKYVVFVGRLSEEKGIHTLIAAWKYLSGIPLKIVGEGPLLEGILRKVNTFDTMFVSILGERPRPETLELIRGAKLLVFTSQCYENFPLVLAEAFACGIPVVAANIGAVSEIVTNGETGLLFSPNDACDLASKVEWLWNHPDQAREMGKAGRSEYENKYDANTNYQKLVDIYENAISFQ